jgi:hypothetical protein
MGKIGITEIILVLFVLGIFVATPLYMAWYFIRRAKVKEKLLLIEKGIDIKDLNLNGNSNLSFPWLRIGIIITGTALGALIVASTDLKPAINQALILLFTGISVILAYYIGKTKDQK